MPPPKKKRKGTMTKKREKKLLILSAAVGAGHITAARAILDACKLEHPELNAVWLDSFDFCPKAYSRLYKGMYALLANRLPHLYGYFYDSKDLDCREGKKYVFADFLDGRLFGRFMRRIEEEQPTHILATHFQPGAAVDRLMKKGRIDAKFGVVGCDFYLHSFWETKGADFYIVASEESKAVFIDRGFSPDAIKIIGIPVPPVFSEPFDRAGLLRKLGLHDRSPIVLTLASGWQKTGPEVMIKALVQTGVDMQIIGVAGRNKESEEKMRAIKTPPGIEMHISGYVNNVSEMMKVADVLVSKPGGLTTVEALSVGLPIIAMNPVPGQEVHNCYYLMEKGAGMLANKTGSLKYKLKKFLGDAEFAAGMRRCATEIGRPRAAFDIADFIAGM